MGHTRTLRTVSGALLASTVLLSTGGTAVADEPRDAQWPLKAFIADDIWKMSKGRGVTVAVIDSGFRESHQDIKKNMLPGKSFGDGEKNGSIRLDPGEDLRDHGTAMSSLIAGHGHGPGKSNGIMGLAPESKILPLSVELSDSNEGQFEAEAIRYAVDNGAKVINMSYVRAQDSRVQGAIDYAVDHDVVLVAGVGNDGIARKWYPATYPGVIGVGAVDKFGKVWEDSNYNSSVDLLAPGVRIPSAGGKGDAAYRMADGTSDGTAYASAAAALVRARYPNLSAGQVANRLVKSTGLPDDLKNAKLPDEHYGYGYIQPRAALSRDIPAGAKEGPLPMPKASDSASTASGKDDSSSSASSRFGGSELALVGIGAAAIVGVAVLLVVRSKRRGRDNEYGPAGAQQFPTYPGQQAPGQAPMPGSPYQNSPQQPTQTPPGQWPNQ
ncbi:S8 family serine peptidase [Streptomyces sp. 8N706]|uniref:S8 family serine peptidase n=1 Tax=Streptomyces sp. 8N706 TaxID=3457416 RepID=UPI003FD12101